MLSTHNHEDDDAHHSRSALWQTGPSPVIAVRLEDGTTVYAFGQFSVCARTAAGTPDRFWQRIAEKSVADAGGDLRVGLAGLPGAKLVHEGPVQPLAAAKAGEARSEKELSTAGRRVQR